MISLFCVLIVSSWSFCAPNILRCPHVCEIPSVCPSVPPFSPSSLSHHAKFARVAGSFFQSTRRKLPGFVGFLTVHSFGGGIAVCSVVGNPDSVLSGEVAHSGSDVGEENIGVCCGVPWRTLKCLEILCLTFLPAPQHWNGSS